MDKKLKGQVFTSFDIVDKILDEVGFVDGILQKTILDPACGDGNFLVRIVKRVVQQSSKDNLAKNLSYIYGWDIDEKHLKQAKQNLDKLVEPLHVEWNLELRDALKVKDNLFENVGKFDFIVGNPPYIRIQNLALEQRTYIQQNYKFCSKGSTDIFIAFFELSFYLLDQNGICGFITPNSYFTTDTAKTLRDEFLVKKNIIKIINYNSIQLFDDATTYSAITIFDLKKRDAFVYQYAQSRDSFEDSELLFETLQNKPFWSLTSSLQEEGVRLKDVADISVGLQTLADKVYISKVDKTDKKFIYLDTFYKGIVKFERDILKPIVKVSTLKSSDFEVFEYIVFPYNDGKIMDEDDFKKRYPLGYKYLLSLRDILDSRDKGKPNKIAWYAFGRNHGIVNSFGKKIVFSSMNKRPNFIYLSDENLTFYSGYSIKADNIEKLLPQLNSLKMQEYMKVNGRDLRGGWKSYNKKIVQEFVLEVQNV